MTITANPVRNEYVGNAGQSIFSYTFKIFESTDLNVYVTPSGQEADDINDLVTGYSVTGLGDEDGGTITLVSPTSLGDLVTIVSAIPRARTTDYQFNGDFLPNVVNDDFDRVVSLVKQNNDLFARSLITPESQQGGPFYLKTPSAGKYLRWDDTASSIENSDISSTDRADTELSFQYSTVEALKLSSLVSGQIADTKGYYSIGDGGAARYFIKTSAEYGGTPNGYSDHIIANGNVAVLQNGLVGLKQANLLQFGAKGNGSDDDTDRVIKAIETGYDVCVTSGYTFMVTGNVTGFSDNQRIFGGGKFKKLGTDLKPVILLDDMIDGLWFDDITIDGNDSLFSPGEPVPCILGYVTQSLKVTGCKFRNSVDVGIKLRNGSHLTAFGNKFEDINTNGIEIRIYALDPRTGLAYTEQPDTYSGYIVSGNTFKRIDDGNSGAGEGCGVIFSSNNGTYFIDGFIVSENTFEDVLRSVWSENPVSGGESRNISITGNTILGNISGAGTIETKDGIGLVQCTDAVISNNTIRNVGNFSPVGGNCAGIQISGSRCDHILIANNNIVDNTGNADRTDYGVYINSAPGVTLRNNMTSGVSEAPYDTVGSCPGLTIIGMGDDVPELSWGFPVLYQFWKQNLAASSTNQLAPAGALDFTSTLSPSEGAVVALSVQLSTPITAGAVTFKVYTNGIERTNLAITETDFAGGTSFTRAIAVKDAAVILQNRQINVRAVTDGSFLPITLDALAVVTYDMSAKL